MSSIPSSTSSGLVVGSIAGGFSVAHCSWDSLHGLGDRACIYHAGRKHATFVAFDSVLHNKGVWPGGLQSSSSLVKLFFTIAMLFIPLKPAVLVLCTELLLLSLSETKHYWNHLLLLQIDF